MKTSEMIAMYENSKCPERLKFASNKGGNIEMKNGILVWTDSGKPFALNLFGHKLDRPMCTTAGTIDRYDWTLAREPVPVEEAFKAYREGKCIFCKYDDGFTKPRKFYLTHKKGEDIGFMSRLILVGTWYIEDSPNEP